MKGILRAIELAEHRAAKRPGCAELFTSAAMLPLAKHALAALIGKVRDDPDCAEAYVCIQRLETLINALARQDLRDMETAGLIEPLHQLGVFKCGKESS